MIKTVNLEIRGKFNLCYVKYMLIFEAKRGGRKMQMPDYDIIHTISLHYQVKFQTVDGM